MNSWSQETIKAGCSEKSTKYYVKIMQNFKIKLEYHIDFQAKITTEQYQSDIVNWPINNGKKTPKLEIEINKM